LTKWLRGPEEMASRVASGPRAVDLDLQQLSAGSGWSWPS